MNYKELFNRIVLFISSPAKAWLDVKNEADGKKVLGEFVYPLIGLCGLSVFLGTFIGNAAGVSSFQIAMTRCCAIFVSLFGGFFLASYLTNLLGKKMLDREDETDLNRQLVGYGMVVIFVFLVSHLDCLYQPVDLERMVNYFVVDYHSIVCLLTVYLPY